MGSGKGFKSVCGQKSSPEITGLILQGHGYGVTFMPNLITLFHSTIPPFLSSDFRLPYEWMVCLHEIALGSTGLEWWNEMVKWLPYYVLVGHTCLYPQYPFLSLQKNLGTQLDSLPLAQLPKIVTAAYFDPSGLNLSLIPLFHSPIPSSPVIVLCFAGWLSGCKLQSVCKLHTTQ